VTAGRQSFAAPAPGQTFGRYRIVRRLGEGATGLVYEAEHLDLRKRVALKVLRPGFADDAAVVARFVREGTAAARIRHPHVVDVTDVGTEHGLPYLVMELLEGETLGALVARGASSVEATATLLLPVCAAVSAAHSRGVLHRDLKPDNIFLVRAQRGSAQPKVLDFGIAKILDDASLSLTATAGVVGTPFYMSPEQARGARELDARSDQYALGVILYECVTGRKPFVAPTLFSLTAEITAGALVPPRALRPEVPPGFEEVVLRAMSRDPEGRFPSVHALGAALVPFADDRTQILWEEAFRGDAEPAAPARPAAPAVVAAALDETVGGPRLSVRRPGRPFPRGVAAIALLALLAGFAVHRATRAPATSRASRVPPVAPQPVTPVAGPPGADAATRAYPDVPSTLQAPPRRPPLRPAKTAHRRPPAEPGQREFPME
jgi:tRNA A-37 threonylcarbamoyl transferase component Bud32